MDIPDELERFSPGIRAEVAEKLGLDGNVLPPITPRCIHFIVNQDGQRQCKNLSMTDGLYCGTHNKQHSDISSDELRSELEKELVS